MAHTEALAIAKERGLMLGNPEGVADLRRAGKVGAVPHPTVKQNADQFAQDLKPVIDVLRGQEITTLRAIADDLNARGMLIRNGGKWQVSNVRNLLKSIRTDDW